MVQRIICYRLIFMYVLQTSNCQSSNFSFARLLPCNARKIFDLCGCRSEFLQTSCQLLFSIRIVYRSRDDNFRNLGLSCSAKHGLCMTCFAKNSKHKNHLTCSFTIICQTIFYLKITGRVRDESGKHQERRPSL